MEATFNIEDVQELKDKYILEECVGSGAYGKVFSAKDVQTSKMKVAIKRQKYNIGNTPPFIYTEYKILKDFCSHPNLPEFYGISKTTSSGIQEICFIMELYEGGQIMDIVNGLCKKNRRMAEEHIAFVLKEVTKALIYLHENNVIHRDVRGSNILLTREGDVKLIDFGLSCFLDNSQEKAYSCLGSPSWMAPEVINAGSKNEEIIQGYDTRADVWSLGITALELGDGRAPFQSMHPTRTTFQIVKNPPPSLNRPADWSEKFTDFIDECLIKNPEHRPYMMEIVEHPFLSQIPDNNYYLTQELKMLYQSFGEDGKNQRTTEQIVYSNFLKRKGNDTLEKMLVEDLATLENLNEESILQELEGRMANGQFYTFVGDVLLALNPNEHQDVIELHKQYQFKSRSDNAPHIFSVADSAYQAALHHGIAQHIILTGESSSGKTTNFLHLIDHLLYLGQNKNINQERIKNAIRLLHAFTHASTPINDYSTRCILRAEITYGNTGKNTGAIFEVHQLDKWRISSSEVDHLNYHILYYFYDGLLVTQELKKYLLDNNQKYNYLRPPLNNKEQSPQQNARKYQKIIEIFQEFQFDERQIESIWNTLSAIINLGNIQFQESAENTVEIVNKEYAIRAANLLSVDERKLIWSLRNYCIRNEDVVERKSRSLEDAVWIRDNLANILYCRVVQYIVNVINHKISIGRVIFGEKYSIEVLDFYGFECFKHNHFPQFLINCTNEEFQYYYLQKIFGWEAVEMNEEGVPFMPTRYYNNRNALEEMLGKSGVLALIDGASRAMEPKKHLIDQLKRGNKRYVSNINDSEFCVGHFTGRVTYDSKKMATHNRNFLPPEVIDVMRSSNNEIVRHFFLNKLDKSGNLITTFEDEIETKNLPPVQVEKERQYSQTKKMRTEASIFKTFSLDLLRQLSVGGRSGGIHFIRCIRSGLQGTPRDFHKEIVRQQLRAVVTLETAKARKRGYAYRVPFSEFLNRYKFLAFDFDENVEVTRDNCRLLLIRLNMEGWVIGKTKVFLKYYNEEYLSRLYETQVQKVIRIQAMIRSYLAKRKIMKKIQNNKTTRSVQKIDNPNLSKEEAAIIVQKVYRGYAGRKLVKSLTSSTDLLDEDLTAFTRFYYDKWRSKSIFQVLLQYRAAKYQDLYNLSQQIHLYNQNVMNVLFKSGTVDLENVSSKAHVESWIGGKKPTVLKLPFHLEDIPYFNTSFMCESSYGVGIDKEEEPWDSSLGWKDTVSSQIALSMLGNDTNINNQSENLLIKLPYNRNPLEPVTCLPNSPLVDLEDDNCGSATPCDTICSEDDEMKISNEKLNDVTNNTTSSATKDFDYIRSSSLEKKNSKDMHANPIIELEIKGRRHSVTSDDDPPFNFQAMLRKTNFRRDSFKRNDDKTVVHQSSSKEIIFESRAKEKQTDQVCQKDLKNLKNLQQTPEMVTNNKRTKNATSGEEECNRLNNQQKHVAINRSRQENSFNNETISNRELNRNNEINKSELKYVSSNIKENTENDNEDEDIYLPERQPILFPSTEVSPGIFMEGIVINV